MKYITLLLIAFALCSSACFAEVDIQSYKADSWLTEIKAANPKVIGASYNNGQCTKFTFDSSATAQEISDANKHLSEFASYTPPAKPDYKAFKGSVFADENVPLGVRLELMKFYPVLDYIEKGEASIEQLQAAWAGIGAQLDIDAPGVRALIEQHATDTHVPLVP